MKPDKGICFHKTGITSSWVLQGRRSVLISYRTAVKEGKCCIFQSYTVTWTCLSVLIYIYKYIYVCVCVGVCYYAFSCDRTIFKRACMLCRVRETPRWTVAKRVMNCAGNEIVPYIKASDCLHDCISVTCTWGSHPPFILNIYCD